MSVRIKKEPNPQGKGQSPVLGYLVETSATLDLPAAREDSRERIVGDYLASLLVISCEFKFRPVRGVSYSIYSQNGRLLLSLISAEEGGAEIFEEHLGCCRLKNDFTWEVTLDAAADRVLRFDTEAGSAVQGSQRFGGVISEIHAGRVGRYDSRLGYYQNVLSFALAKSIALRGERLLEYESRSGVVASLPAEKDLPDNE